MSQLTPGQVIAIAGKTLRHSYERSNHKAEIQLVSAWASRNCLGLGQRQVDDSNEMTAIPQRLLVLAIEGCIVTSKAMSCQKDARQIVAQEAD